MLGIFPLDKTVWLPGLRNGRGTEEAEEGLLESIYRDKLFESP